MANRAPVPNYSREAPLGTRVRHDGMSILAESSTLEGYTAIPNLLIDALGGENGSTYSVVLFIARHTIGRQMKLGEAFYRVKEVCLSYDEFARGRRRQDGSRMQDTSGLKYDDAIERGILNAVAHGFIDIVSATGQRGVHVYTIADRFWLAAGFTTALKMLADPRIAESATAWKIIAVGAQKTSSAPENPSSSAREIQAMAAPQPALEEAGRDFKQRSKQRENKEDTKMRASPSARPVSLTEHHPPEDNDGPTSANAPTLEVDASLQASAPLGEEERSPVREELADRATGQSMADGTGTQEVEALVQRFADQQILQSLLAERKRLQALQPGQSG